MSDEQILSILSDNAEFFKINEIFSQVFRYLGWLLIESLSIVSRELENVNNKIYSMIDFFNFKGISELIDMFKPVIWVILVVSICYISIQFIINRRFQKEGLYTNFVMAVMVIMLLPSLMVQVSKMTQNAVLAVNGEYNTTADKIVKANVTDLYYLDKNNFSVGDVKNGIPESKITKISINESVDSSQTDNKEVFKNKIQSDENGEEKIVKMSRSFGVIEEKYFRYTFNFFTIIISIGCTVLAQVFVAIKIARVSFDLAFTKLFAMIYAFGDIASGQRLKSIIQNIFASFAIIVSSSFLLKIYTLLSGWVATNSDGNMAIQLIFLIAGAWAVIDGPDIVERVFGIDAGVKSSAGVITSTYAGAKILGGVINAGKSVVSGGAGAISSMKASVDNLHNANNNSDIDSEKLSKGFNDNSQDDNSNNGISLTESNDTDSVIDDAKSSIDDNLENSNPDSFNDDSDINSTDGVDLDKLKQDLSSKEDIGSTSIKDDINDNSNGNNNDLGFGSNSFNDQPLDNIDNGNNANINNVQDPGIDFTPSSPINDKITEDFKDDAIDLNSNRLKNESIEFGLDNLGTQDINYDHDKESTYVDKNNLNSKAKDPKTISSIGHMNSSNNDDFNKIYNQRSRTDISNNNTDNKNT